LAEARAKLTRRSDLESAAAAFIDDLASDAHRSPDTVSAYRSDLCQFALFLYPRVGDLRLPLSSVSTTLVHAYRDELTNRGLRGSTVARKLAVIRSFFKFLCRSGITIDNPAANVASPTVSRTAARALPVEQVEAALEQVNPGQFAGARDRAILDIFYTCGLMLRELVGLNLSTLNLAEGFVRVGGRGARVREVPYGEGTRSVLDHYLQLRAEHVSNLDLSEIDVGALFVNHRGRRLHPRTVQRIVDRNLSKVVEETAAGPRMLRNSCATHMVEAGAETAAVKELLGQTSLAGAAASRTDLERLRQIYQQAHPRA
jgi:integrase/recombinase XerC